MHYPHLNKIKMKLFFVIINLLCCTLSLAQIGMKIDSVYRKEAQRVLNSFFKDDIGKNNIVLFSIGVRNYLVIVDDCKKYKEYVVVSLDKNKMKKKLKKKISKSDELLGSLFKKENYNTDYTNISSILFEDGYNITIDTHNDFYFVLVDKEQQYFGETLLPIGIIPNPINKIIYDYLFKSLVNSVNK